MSVTQDQVVDYIKNLKLGQVKELISILEDELGVSASAPVMAMGLKKSSQAHCRSKPTSGSMSCPRACQP